MTEGIASTVISKAPTCSALLNLHSDFRDSIHRNETELDAEVRRLSNLVELIGVKQGAIMH